MKASDITRLFRLSAPVFGWQVSAWMTLVEICDAGPDGVTLTKLCNGLKPGKRQSFRSTLYRWTKAGLLERRETPARTLKDGTLGSQKKTVFFATDKAFQLLRLEPTK